MAGLIGHIPVFSFDKIGDNPHTSWIKPSDENQQAWLQDQISKKACERVTVQEIYSYIQGEKVSIRDFELTKARMKTIETNWRARISKKGKSTLTISAQANRRFRKFCKEGKLSTIELFDRIAEQYTPPTPNQITEPILTAPVRSSSGALVAMSRIPALISQLEELTRLFEEKSQAAWREHEVLADIGGLDLIPDELSEANQKLSQEEVDRFKSLAVQIRDGLNALNKSCGL